MNIEQQVNSNILLRYQKSEKMNVNKYVTYFNNCFKGQTNHGWHNDSNKMYGMSKLNNYYQAPNQS